MKLSPAAPIAVAVIATGMVGAQASLSRPTSTLAAATPTGKVVPLKDARLKFEVNATDSDAGVQLFVDAESWREISLFDPSGRRILTTTTEGAIAKQGGTELFLESAEPTFAQLSRARLFKRFPAGKYRIRGIGLRGERYVGSAILTHDIPAGPQLIAPLRTQPAPKPDDTTVSWKPVPAANGSPIIGYQVLVVQPASGIRALPKITLDVTMPATATSLKVPPGFLRPATKYEWEVVAIERGGNQTLSSDTFTTAP